MSETAASKRRDDDPGQRWMLALQAGEDAAFTRIVERYGPSVVRFFRRLGAEAAAAEDLTQETFLRVFRARDRYEPTARFQTWLFRIVHRIAMNDGTRNRWRRAVPLAEERSDSSEGPSGHPELTDERGDPVEQVDGEEVRAQVRQAVAALPPNQREALILHRFQGLSYEELGRALELSVPAVKSLLFRARENVKKLLSPLLHEEATGEVR